MTISNEAVEAVCEAHVTILSRDSIREILEAAAPIIRAEAVIAAADELARLTRIGRTPARDVTEDENADYYAFAATGGLEQFLRARAAAERGRQ